MKAETPIGDKFVVAVLVMLLLALAASLTRDVCERLDAVDARLKRIEAMYERTAVQPENGK